MYQKHYHIHFVGIGGIGMSGIAEVLIHMGYSVSGSDLKRSKITDRLIRLGAKIYETHAETHVKEADVVVRSSAIPRDNPELVSAEKAGIPVIRRAQMLAELMMKKYSIAVSGAHGKTTTTGMLADLLTDSKMDPTVVIGGHLKSSGTNGIFGNGKYMVVEADESDGSFLHMTPAIILVTNIDMEHLDFYRDLGEIQDMFRRFIDRLPFYGCAVLCLDSEGIRDIIPKLSKRFVTYGQDPTADYNMRHVVLEGMKSRFDVYHRERKLGEMHLNLPGYHNICNALSVIAVGAELGIPFDRIRNVLRTVKGVERRLETKGKVQGITVIDDYGHHPTENQCILKTLRDSYPGQRIVVVFQPHRYTRTERLFHDFTRAFDLSDLLILLPIYSAGETAIPGVSSASLAESIGKRGHENVFCVKDHAEAVGFLKDRLRSKDVLLTMGAGDVWQVGETLLDLLGDE